MCTKCGGNCKDFKWFGERFQHFIYTIIIIIFGGENDIKSAYLNKTWRKGSGRQSIWGIRKYWADLGVVKSVPK